MCAMGIIGHSLFLFQTYKIISTKSSKDISLTGFFIAFLSITSWLVYGLLIKDRVLIYVNIVGFIAALFCILAIIFV